MFGNAFGWPHLLIILAVILLLFGAARLPALARSVGQSARAFRGEMKALKDEDKKDDQTTESEAATDVAAGTVTSEAANGATGSAPEPKP